MAETEEIEEQEPKKASKLPLLIGFVLALVAGGGGFYAAFSGMILGPESAEEMAEEEPVTVKDMPDVAFVPVEPLIIPLGHNPGTNLRFRAQLEVRGDYTAEVEKLMPRVVDVLNSYLRAVDIKDLQNNASLVRLRAQMLRRIQVVTGGDRVRDLLIMEFVLN